MTYRIVKDGPSFLVAMDSLDDPPMSIVSPDEPAFITLAAAVRRRAQLEDELVAMRTKTAAAIDNEATQATRGRDA